jgi:hypothetical protein
MNTELCVPAFDSFILQKDTSTLTVIQGIQLIVRLGPAADTACFSAIVQLTLFL